MLPCFLLIGSITVKLNEQTLLESILGQGPVEAGKCRIGAYSTPLVQVPQAL